MRKKHEFDNFIQTCQISGTADHYHEVVSFQFIAYLLYFDDIHNKLTNISRLDENLYRKEYAKKHNLLC